MTRKKTKHLLPGLMALALVFSGMLMPGNAWADPEIDPDTTDLTSPTVTLSVDSEKQYVERYMAIEFSDIGVTGYDSSVNTYEASSNITVYPNEQTIWAYGDGTIDWYAGESLVGTTTIATYENMNDWYELNLSTANQGSSAGWTPSLPEGMSYNVADNTVAEVEKKVSKYYWIDDDGKEITEEFTYNILEPLKVGATTISMLKGDELIKISPVTVYNLSTTLKGAQAIGTSQTFTFNAPEGYTIESVSAYGGYSSEDSDEYVTFTDNKDGSYTLTAKAMPSYVMSETGETVVYPYTGISVMATSPQDHQLYNNWTVVLYEVETTDAASEAAEGESTDAVATSNEAIMADYVGETISAFFDNEDMPEEGGPAWTLTLSDNSMVTIADPYAFYEAVITGQTIEAVLTEPATMTEDQVGASLATGMKNELGTSASGARFLDINIALVSQGVELGRITDLSTPVIVTMDVSADRAANPIKPGYTRKYKGVRYHNNQIMKMSDSDFEYDVTTDTLRMRGDGFSIFLIAYEDVPDVTVTTASNVNAPNSGALTQFATEASTEASEAASATTNNTMTIIVAVIAALVLAGVVVFAKRR